MKRPASGRDLRRLADHVHPKHDRILLPQNLLGRVGPIDRPALVVLRTEVEPHVVGAEPDVRHEVGHTIGAAKRGIRPVAAPPDAPLARGHHRRDPRCAEVVATAVGQELRGLGCNHRHVDVEFVERRLRAGGGLERDRAIEEPVELERGVDVGLDARPREGGLPFDAVVGRLAELHALAGKRRIAVWACGPHRDRASEDLPTERLDLRRQAAGAEFDPPADEFQRLAFRLDRCPGLGDRPLLPKRIAEPLRLLADEFGFLLREHLARRIAGPHDDRVSAIGEGPVDRERRHARLVERLLFGRQDHLAGPVADLDVGAGGLHPAHLQAADCGDELFLAVPGVREVIELRLEDGQRLHLLCGVGQPAGVGVPGLVRFERPIEHREPVHECGRLREGKLPGVVGILAAGPLPPFLQSPLVVHGGPGHEAPLIKPRGLAVDVNRLWAVLEREEHVGPRARMDLLPADRAILAGPAQSYLQVFRGGPVVGRERHQPVVFHVTAFVVAVIKVVPVERAEPEFDGAVLVGQDVEARHREAGLVDRGEIEGLPLHARLEVRRIGLSRPGAAGEGIGIERAVEVEPCHGVDALEVRGLELERIGLSLELQPAEVPGIEVIDALGDPHLVDRARQAGRVPAAARRERRADAAEHSLHPRDGCEDVGLFGGRDEAIDREGERGVIRLAPRHIHDEGHVVPAVDRRGAGGRDAVFTRHREHDVVLVVEPQAEKRLAPQARQRQQRLRAGGRGD